MSSVDIFNIHDLKTRSQNKRSARLCAHKQAVTFYNNIQWCRSHRHFDEEVRNLLISLFQITLLFTTCLCVVASSAPGENENRNLSLIDFAIAIAVVVATQFFFFFNYFSCGFSCCSHLIRDRMWLHSNDLLQMLYVHFDKFFAVQIHTRYFVWCCYQENKNTCKNMHEFLFYPWGSVWSWKWSIQSMTRAHSYNVYMIGNFQRKQLKELNIFFRFFYFIVLC